MNIHRLTRIEAGRGGEPLLLVHGFTGGKVDFADHLDGFAAAGFHAVAPDLPGHGASDGEVFTFESFAAAVVGLADELGWTRFTLLGHSMGGVVAQHVALTAPARLDGLVLVDTTATRFGIDPAVVDLACMVVETEGMGALLAAQKAIGSPFESDAARRLRAERAGWEELQDAKLLASSPAMYVAMARALTADADRTGPLARLDVPTLVVVGEHDVMLLDAARHLAATIPGAELAVIAGAGHSPQVEAPEAWFDAVVSWLTRGSARRRRSHA